MVKTLVLRLTAKPVVFLLIISILVLVVVQLILSNQLAGSSGRLSKILTEAAVIERENRDLSVKIYQKGSISNLKEQAESFGFSEPKKFLFVKKNFLVAENR